MTTEKLSRENDLKRRFFVSFWLILGLCVVAVRVFYLAQPVRHDEAYVYNNLVNVSLPAVLGDYSHPDNHIFHSVLVYFSTSIFGDALWAMRLPALVAGLLLIVAEFEVTRRFYGRKPAFIAATLIGVSIPLIEFSVNARGYTLITLFTTLLMLEAKRLQDGDGGRWWRYVLWAVLGLYTIPVVLYSVVAVSLWLLLSQWHAAGTAERMGITLRLGGVMAAIGLLTLAVYTPVLLNTGPESLFNNEFVLRLDRSAFLATLPETFGEMLNILHQSMNVSVVGLLAAGLVVALAQHGKLTDHPYPILPIFIVVIILMLLLQQVHPLPRTWLILLPPYLMTASAGIAWLVGERRWIIPPLAVLLGFAVVDAVRLEVIPQSERTGRVPYAEEAAAQIEDALLPADSLFAPTPINEPVRYYLQRAERADLAAQVIDPLRYQQQDLLTDGELYVLAEADTPPQIVSMLQLDPTQLTVRGGDPQAFGKLTLQQVELGLVQSGTVLFEDSFDQASLPGWETTGINRSVMGDSLRLQTGEAWGSITLLGTENWQDYRVALLFDVLEQDPAYEGLYLGVRHTDEGRYVAVLDAERGEVGIAWENADGSQDVLERRPLPLTTTPPYELSIAAINDTLRLSVNGNEVLSIEDDRSASGGVQLAIPPNTQIRVDRLRVSAVSLSDESGPSPTTP